MGELQSTIELKEEVSIANELCHPILEQFLVELEVVLAPGLHLPPLKSTTSFSILSYSSDRGSSLIFLWGLFSTTWTSLISSFSFPI